MSTSENNYYIHPYLNNLGYIVYRYESFPLSIEKQWSIVADALKFNITNLYNSVIEDIDSTTELKTKVYNLYSKITELFKYKSSNQTNSEYFYNKLNNLSIIL